MKKTLQQILGLLPALVDDVKIAKERLEQQYSRRVYVRTLFAMIEGVTYSVKQALFVIAHNFDGSGRIKVGEMVILKGSSFDLNDKGEVQEKEKYFRIKDNLKFTVNSINHVLGSRIDLGADTKDWSNFVNAVKIRNRITHPKELADLNISDEDLACIDSVNSWFNNIVAAIMVALKHFFSGNHTKDSSGD